MGDVFSIGVLGASSFAQRMMIPLIQKHDEFKLVGVASRTLRSHSEFEVYSDYRALVESADVRAVYIPLPNSMHHEWILRSLNAGKHVLCEKSLCCELDQVKEVTSLAQELNLVLMENFHFRYHPQLALVKQLIADGRIGELRCIRSYFGFPPFPDQNNIRYAKALGGGALLDAGAYPLRIMLELLGPSLSVLSAKIHTPPDREVDIWGAAHLTSDGVDCFAGFGFHNHYQCVLEVWGTDGIITTNRVFTAPPNMSVKVLVEDSQGKSELTVEPFNSYTACLERFHTLACDAKSEAESLDAELNLNLAQALLIDRCKKMSSAE